MLTLPYYIFNKGLHTFLFKPPAPFALPLAGVWPDPKSGVLVHLSSGSGHPRTPPSPPNDFLKWFFQVIDKTNFKNLF